MVMVKLWISFGGVVMQSKNSGPLRRMESRNMYVPSKKLLRLTLGTPHDTDGRYGRASPVSPVVKSFGSVSSSPTCMAV
jgi:hypothetical protein